MTAPIKSVLLIGKVSSALIYRLCPSTEFSEGVWNLCLSSIAYSCTTPNIEELCSISCNMVKSQRFNQEFIVESYEQPLGLCLIKTQKYSANFGNHLNFLII